MILLDSITDSKIHNKNVNVLSHVWKLQYLYTTSTKNFNNRRDIWFHLWFPSRRQSFPAKRKKREKGVPGPGALPLMRWWSSHTQHCQSYSTGSNRVTKVHFTAVETGKWSYQLCDYTLSLKLGDVARNRIYLRRTKGREGGEGGKERRKEGSKK